MLLIAPAIAPVLRVRVSIFGIGIQPRRHAQSRSFPGRFRGRGGGGDRGGGLGVGGVVRCSSGSSSDSKCPAHVLEEYLAFQYSKLYPNAITLQASACPIWDLWWSVVVTLPPFRSKPLYLPAKIRLRTSSNVFKRLRTLDLKGRTDTQSSAVNSGRASKAATGQHLSASFGGVEWLVPSPLTLLGLD